jgi:hypothetical protein
MRGAVRLSLAAVAAIAPLVLLESSAEAQTGRVPGSTWRQRDRTEAIRRSEGSPQNFAFELRFGPYSPEVDETPGSSGAYKTFFGDSAQFYFGMEFDYLPFRIPFVGVIGAGFGWGYTTTSANAKLAADTSKDAGEETSLTIMPMHLSLVLRADELMRRTSVPIVPYAKFGYGLGWWRASDGNGTSVRTDPVTGAKLTGDADTGLGTTSGIHLALGGMLALNFLDPRAIARLDESTGVNHIYVFGEWMNARLTGLGSRPQMHVGTSTVIVGLAMDM